MQLNGALIMKLKIIQNAQQTKQNIRDKKKRNCLFSLHKFMMVFKMVRIKARKPNVAKEPTLPVGQPDRPLSKCLLSNVAIKLWELEEAKMSKTQITKQICFSLIFTVLLDNKTARVWLEFC